MRLTTAIIMFSMATRAQNPLMFPQSYKKTMLFERKMQHFKFTATMKPGNTFVQNSEINLAGGLNYEVRAKMYVNKRLSILMKTKNRTRAAQDIASFGIIFKL